MPKLAQKRVQRFMLSVLYCNHRSLTFENNLNKLILLSHCYFLEELGAGALLKFSLFFFTKAL